jgi:glycine/D-amino acid oxidase-like deaminating enzyme
MKSIPHLVLDIGKIGSGASGTPAGLLNPASAQKARFSSLAPNCIAAFEKLYKSVSVEVNCSDVLLSNHILRPALDETLSTNFQDSITNGDWPAGWVSWLNQHEIQEFGSINAIGGMFIKKGFAIDFRAWIKALATFTASKEATIVENCIYTISSTSDGFAISVNGKDIVSSAIIDCTGSSDRFKSHFKWHPVKGQTRIVKTVNPITLKTAVSGYGYVVKRGDKLVLGSTYEHHFDDEQPSADKDHYLLNKANMVIQEALSVSNIEERWAGIRVSTPDRLPAIGSTSQDPNFHFIFGLGSKGLFYSAWAAAIITGHLIDGTSIPRQYHVSRLLK